MITDPDRATGNHAAAPVINVGTFRHARDGRYGERGRRLLDFSMSRRFRSSITCALGRPAREPARQQVAMTAVVGSSAPGSHPEDRLLRGVWICGRLVHDVP